MAERDRLRRIVGELPRMTAVGVFLSGSASHLLDLQMRVEDILRAVGGLTGAANEGPMLEGAVTSLRLLIPGFEELFGRLVAGTRFDLTSVNEALAVEEPVPGLSPALLSRLRASQTRNDDSSRANNQRRRNMQQHAAAMAAANSHMAAVPTPPPAPLVLPLPVAAGRRPPNFNFACDACGMFGHWKAQGVCRPADVQRQLARLAALAAQVAPPDNPQPGPSGAGTSGGSGGSGTSGPSSVPGRLFYKFIFVLA